MALITCPHCGKPVSSRAVKCPHCGCDLKDKDVAEKPKVAAPEPQHNAPIVEEEGSTTNYGKKIVIVLAVIILVVGCFFGYQKYCGNKVAQDIVADSTAYDSIYSDMEEVDTTIKVDDTEAKSTDKEFQKKSEMSRRSSSHEALHKINGVEYIAQLASRRILDYDDISELSGSELRLVRNWIFARYGYAFRSPELQRYFGSKSWYTPMYSDVSSRLTNIERRNVKFIKQYEER